MELDWLNWFTYLGIAYAVMYTGSKLIFSIMSLLEIRIYFWRYDHIIEEDELQKHLDKNHHELPLISIISPAFNEGVLIVDTVSSFLNQSYRNKEIIICSDGGTDGTLEKLIEHFELVEVPDTFEHSPHIGHKPIKRYFKSANPAYKDLLVIDKENGGKADAQNAGVAIARGEIVTIIDADSILEKYALIHLADIFERERRVIGIGTPIGVVNDCNIGPDGVDDASVPRSFWAKIQVIEYLRSFLLGRMFAQRYRGLQIVSGAFGVYKKWIIEAVGGYSTGSLAEDMDIDGKIWRYIDTNRLKYRIRYIPEAFCWSEVPNTLKSLASQRDRWARGMTETIWKNRDLFFNPKYKLLGLFSYPYYVFFEWLTPFIEIIGLLYFVVGASLGWFSFIILEYIFIVYWLIGVVLNITALSVEAFTRGHYKNRGTLLRLSLFAIIEPLFYHWINSYLYVMGNLKMLFGKRGWGNMERAGLKKKDLPPTNGRANHAEHATLSTIKAATNGNTKVEEEIAEFQVASVNGSRSYLKWAVVPALVIIAVLVWRFLIKEDKSFIVDEQIVQDQTPAQQMKLDSVRYNDINTSVNPDSVLATENNETETITAEKSENTLMSSEENLLETSGNTLGKIEILTEKTGQFYIVVASLLDPDNVDNYTQGLSTKGIDCVVIRGYSSRQLNLISVAHAATEDEARKQLNHLRHEYGEGLWILNY